MSSSCTFYMQCRTLYGNKQAYFLVKGQLHQFLSDLRMMSDGELLEMWITSIKVKTQFSFTAACCIPLYAIISM